VNDPIVIVGLARTPMGAFQGELKGFAAPELGAFAIRAAVERAKIKQEEVDEVIMGCVLPAGRGQAPARQAWNARNKIPQRLFSNSRALATCAVSRPSVS
jgi:acetyl-CoA C-acetyltransferase